MDTSGEKATTSTRALGHHGLTILAFLCLLFHHRADAVEFTSTASLTLNDNAEASPYPSTLTVSGVSGIIGSVRVKLNGFSHTRPADLDIFLVAPNGQMAAVMSDAGGEVEATALNLVFDDTAAIAIPATGPLTSGTFQPANHEPGEPPAPGATLPSNSKFTVMANGGVNGPWKLYVRDDQTGETGTLTSWALEIETTNALNASYTTGTEVPLTTESFTATGKTVTFALNHAPIRGANFTVVNNTALGFIQGTFEGLPNSATVDIGFGGITYHFIAWYYGGDGNDLVLLWRDTALSAWGNNYYGQIGIGSFFSSWTAPNAVNWSGVLAGKTLVAATAGDTHSLALCSDGTLATWGRNPFYPGNDTTDAKSVPAAVPQNGVLAGKSVVAIASGSDHNLALCSDGTLAAWGQNNAGQLGDGSTLPRNDPVAIMQSEALSGKTVVAITAGGQHSLALCSDGSLVAWGHNGYGQLGDNSTTNRTFPVSVNPNGALGGKTVTAISAGAYHSLALCSDFSLSAWGRGDMHQLGNGSPSNQSTPAAVTDNGALAGKTVVAIAAGGNHNLALCSDGSLAGWGDNQAGQLMDNTTSPRTIPMIIRSAVLPGKKAVSIVAGLSHSLALCSDGTLASWGDNLRGQLGRGRSPSPSFALNPAPVIQDGLLAGNRFLGVAGSCSSATHSLALYAVPPEIAVEHPAEFNLPNGTATISFGTAPLVQGESERTFTIRNRTRGDLTVFGVTLDGTNSGDFTVTRHPEVQLSFGTSTTFTVRFKPTSLGEKTATLHIASNDGDENPFDITLTGTGIPGAHIRVGDSVTLDLSWVSLAGGETLKVSGLPPGLVLNAGAPPIITGTALGLVPNGGTIIQVLRSGKVVRTLPLNLVIDSHRLAGTYELLLEEGGQPSGKLSFTVSNPNKAVPNPAFTATLERLGQSKRRAKGSFIASGSPQTVPIVFPSSNTASALTLNVVLTSGSDLATAVTQPASGLTARGFRLAHTSRIPSGNPQITLTLPPTIPGDRVSTPGGIGHARGTVTSTALVSLAGQLGDAQPFTTSLSLSQTNQAVVWMTPYANKTSCIGGIINMADTGAADRRASAEMATTGLQWKKQADARAIAYPAGFGPLTLSARCSRWVASVQAEGLAQSLALDFRALDAAYISPTPDLLSARFSLRDNFTLLSIAPDNAVPFTGKTTASIGTFSGIFTLPTPANRSPLSGVFLQDDTFNPLIGQGLVRIPVGGGVKGSYQTAGIEFRQPTSLGTHRYRIGDTVNIDLRAIIVSGESLKILGLPPGLGQFGTVVTGTITGLGPSTGVKLQVFNGKTLVRTLPLDFAVEPYLFADSCELLLEDADAGLPVGKLKVTISSPSAKQPSPGYSATLDFLGHPRRSSKGTFTPTGTPQVVRVDFPAYQSFSSGTFYLTFTAGSNQVNASTGRGFFVPIRVTGRGFRLARLGHIPTGNPPLTMTFPPVVPGNRTTTPAGVGYAKGTISSQALIPLSGMLGDAQSFTTSLHLSQTNQAVVWLTPYKNKSSYFGGIIDIAAPATPDRGAVLGAHTAGVNWARLADASAPSYPAGFSALSLTAKSSRWVPAKPAAVLADSLGLTFRGINASYIAPTTDLLPNFWSLRDNSSLLRIAPTNAVPFTGKALGTNGTFTGNLTLPIPAAKSAMSGVFLQDATFGQAIGQGLIKVPITAPVKGSFQTFGVELGN